MKRFVTLSILVLSLLFATKAEGKTGLRSKYPFLKFGVEWGGGISLFEAHRFVYTDEIIGCLLPADEEMGFSFVPTAYLLLNFGANIGHHSSIQIEGGFSGVHEDRRVFPIQLRYSYLFNGCNRDGVFVFGCAGVAFPDNGSRRLASLASFGGGWRFSLSRSISLDFLASLRGCFDHPEVWNDDLGKYVPDNCIRRNNAGYAGINVGIALNF